MSFPCYPKYKNSGVPWLGEVPEHWTLPKLKSIASFSGGGTPSRENTVYWNGNIPWVSPKDMKADQIDRAEEAITKEGLESSATRLLPPGCLLMVVRSGILKHTIPVAINATSVALNQDMKALIFDPGRCIGRFFLRWVQGLNDRLLLAWAKQGATVESIEHSYLADTIVPLPDIAEQTRIAKFLDEETAKIDELIAEQQRLIGLLKEKRQAVIAHAVTKGLNPDAPMKPSGIEWLGDIPTHWEVNHLRRLIKKGTTITYGIVQAGPDVEGGIPYIRTSDMAGQSLPENGYLRTTPEIDASYVRSKVMPDDLVVAIRASLGKGLLVPKFLDGANLTQGTARICPGPMLLPRFLFWSFNSSYCQTSIRVVAKGTTFLEITLDALRRIAIVVPPVIEQAAIVAHLDSIAAKLDALIAEAQRAIDLLQ
jgi:type I restriction enzyme S subunit